MLVKKTVLMICALLIVLLVVFAGFLAGRSSGADSVGENREQAFAIKEMIPIVYGIAHQVRSTGNPNVADQVLDKLIIQYDRKKEYLTGREIEELSPVLTSIHQYRRETDRPVSSDKRIRAIQSRADSILSEDSR